MLTLQYFCRDQKSALPGCIYVASPGCCGQSDPGAWAKSFSTDSIAGCKLRARLLPGFFRASKQEKVEAALVWICELELEIEWNRARSLVSDMTTALKCSCP